MSRSTTQVISAGEAPGDPAIVRVPGDHACIVIAPDGQIDLALVPPGEAEDGSLSVGGTVATAVMIAMMDPEIGAELRALLGKISRRHLGGVRALLH